MESHRLPDIHYQGPNLDVPEPPDDLPYARFGDYYNREVLRLNGTALAPDAVIDLLSSPASDPILRAAAAHTAGAENIQSAAPALRQALSAADDLTAVEAAYALARLGQEEGRVALEAAVGRPVGPNLGPLCAAGYLAQLGDRSGFPVVVGALGGDEPTARMLAAKQLHFFIPSRIGREPGAGGADITGAFERALAHPDTALHWQALVQLRETSEPALLQLVRRYAARAPDAALARMAQSILDRVQCDSGT